MKPKRFFIKEVEVTKKELLEQFVENLNRAILANSGNREKTILQISKFKVVGRYETKI